MFLAEGSDEVWESLKTQRKEENEAATPVRKSK
jgi:hypothetical protein